MATNTAADGALLDEIASRAPDGLLVPPHSVRGLIESTAGYVARNGNSFEERIKNAPQGAKLTFLKDDDPFRPYYLWRRHDLEHGDGNAIAAGRAGEVSFSGKERKGPEKPEDFTFSARMPHISAKDLEVIKLTAMFVAKNGRSWMMTLSQREAGNPQFDFLRPTHTFYQFFSRLVDQYSELLNGDTNDSGRPQKKRIVQLEENVKSKQSIIDRAKKRSEWVRHQDAQKTAVEEKAKKEQEVYASIDWHDFVVVETVLFDERDEHTELPAPTTKNDLQSSSLEQKAAMSIDPSRRLEEAFPGESYQQYYTPPPSATVYQPPPQQHAVQPPAASTQPVTDSNNRMSTIQADRERVRAAQEAAAAAAPMKIRQDHIPRAQAKNASQTMMLCPNCKQSIPANEIENHMRIELLDPRWREQSKIAQQRASTTNLNMVDVAANLKRLVSQRQDVFDPVTGRPTEEPDAKRAVPPGGIQNVSNTTDVNAQIKQLHQKFGGQ